MLLHQLISELSISCFNGIIDPFMLIDQKWSLIKYDRLTEQIDDRFHLINGRIALGSATVAGMTAAGIVSPLVAMSGVSPELMVLAAGAGSMTFSHVNDAGFWIYKEYFNLSIGQTVKTWSVMVTIISLVGLAGVLILNMLV